SPPAMVTPSLPPAATATSTVPAVAAIPEKGAFSLTTPAPLPSTPLPQSPSSSHLPPAKPSSIVETETESLLWAKALVASYRPRWQLKLTKSFDPTMKGEGYAVSIDPNNQVTVEAKTQAGWLYGLLDLAERLQWRDQIPAQWRWVPALSERGLVVENPDWLVKPHRSLQTFQSLLRERMKELAWWRFNTLVLKCDGREPSLDIVFNILNRLAPEFNVKVVVWASVVSPAVQKWMRQGGQIVATSQYLQGNIVAVSEPEQAIRFAELGKTAVLTTKLVAPNAPPSLLQVKGNRDKLVLLVKLDEGYRDVFWFDPEWAHQLVRSVRDAGLKGFWLSVRSVPSSWAVAAFAQAVKNPDADGENLWRARWERQGHQAGKWLSVFREASRILPELLWLGVATEPQYGASLNSFFVASPIDSSWGFTVLSVPETLRLSRTPDDRTTLTADELARRLEQRAQTVWSLAAQLPEPSASDWKVAKRLALLNSWLGQFYANKIDAAMAWGKFEEGDKAAGQDTAFHLAKSVRAWEQIVAIANSVYSQNNKWALRLIEFQRELNEFGKLAVGSMP
ncbi:MAG: hypothetical protein RMK89_05505, partial [Armatimonadota bacterium]|nr:hypothetical protein [Armatimonadota bacterium]MDW8142903.1 hypothetical protein [Armatimonadota bacterium]